MDRVAERNDVAGRPDKRLPIPSEDLTRQYAKIRAEILAAIEETLPRGKYTMGLALDDRVRTLRYMGQYEKHLPEWTAARQRWAALYDELLADTPLTLPYRAPNRTQVFYMYTVRTPDRDALQAFLRSRGIGSQVIYPRAVPDQPAYSKAPCRVVSADRARSIVGDILCLPVFPELEEEEVRAVSAAIHDFFAGR